MTPPMIRTSERRSWRRCPQQHQWGWVEGLTPRRIKPALWLGTGVHEALAEFYRYKGIKRRGPHPAETFAEWAEGSKRTIWANRQSFEEEERMSALDLGVAMLNGYVEEYGSDERVSVIAREDSFELGIPHPKHPERVSCLFCGTFDLVYRDLADGSIWLMEHKTAKAIKTSHLTLDDQAGGYWLAATTVLRHKKLIGPRESLAGIRYNFLRKAMPDDRPVNDEGQRLNKDGSVSARQPTALFKRHPVFRTPRELASIRQRILNESWMIDQARKGRIPVVKNPTRDCDWECAFFEMCDLHEKGDDWESFRDLFYVKVDPYAAHKTTEDEEAA